MKLRIILLATAAAASLIADGATAATRKAVHSAPSNQALLDRIAALDAEIEALRAEVHNQAGAQAATRQQVSLVQAQAADAQTQAAVAAKAVSAAAAPVTNDQVATQIASAIDKEHHNDRFYLKGITIQPGGFLELAGIYRSRFQGDDIASSFSIPFPSQSHQSHTSEGRFSARQSRLSFLAQGNANKTTLLSMYGEFDFQGAAQTANSNQSNSYQPRIRNLYGTIDWNEGDHGWHLLAGQNWSLLTMQGKGMTPRAEITPPQIDAQYVPGFAWARQPGVRFVGDFLDHTLWLGVAAENPQTTFGGTGVPSNVTSVLAGQNGTTSPPTGSFQQFYNGAGASLSLNHMPDFIGKAAVETTLAGHALHVEGFGIYRTFTEHFNGSAVVTGDKSDAHGFGYGGSVNLQLVPKLIDVQFSGIGGRGIGRYGSAGLPDATFDKEGNIHPLKEFMLLAGATVHPTSMLDVYLFAGEEQEDRKLLDDGTAGLGLPTANNMDCLVEGGTNCAGNTRRIRQLTGGFWQKIYSGSFGRAQVGVQYSYTQRQLFSGIGGAPQTHNSMGFVSFRYYPF